MENASSVCFTDLLAHGLACHYDPESKAFLGMQEGKDEEEDREMKRNI